MVVIVFGLLLYAFASLYFKNLFNEAWKEEQKLLTKFVATAENFRPYHNDNLKKNPVQFLGCRSGEADTWMRFNVRTSKATVIAPSGFSGKITITPTFTVGPAFGKFDGAWKPLVVVQLKEISPSPRESYQVILSIAQEIITEPRMAALYNEGGSSKDFDPNKEPDHLFRIVAPATWYFEPAFLPSSIQKADAWEIHNLPGGQLEGPIGLLTPAFFIGKFIYRCY